MARLPQPGSDAGKWGDILNDYLSQIHKVDGSLKDGVVGSAHLRDNSVTSSKLADDVAASPVAGALVKRTDTGALKATQATEDDEVMTLGQFEALIRQRAEEVALDTLDGMALTSGPDVAGVGDSKTAGAGGGGTTWTGKLQDIVTAAYDNPGVVYNLGVGGENTPTIVGRALLGTPWMATVAGGQIPTGGSVTLTLQSASGAAVAPLIQGSRGVNPVKIADVTGTLTLTDGVYRFTPSIYPSTPVTLDGPVAVSTQAQRDRQSDLMVIMIGQNDSPQSVTTMTRYIGPAIQYLKAMRKRYIVVGFDTGTAAARAAMETALTAEYGDKFLNMRSYMSTTNALVAEGIVPTEDDLAAIANGSCPPSFWATSSDSIHRNAAGYRRYARAIYEKIKSLGWNDMWGTLHDDSDTLSSILAYDHFMSRPNGESIVGTTGQIGTGTWGVLGSGTAIVDSGTLAITPSGFETFCRFSLSVTDCRLTAVLAAKAASSPYANLVFRQSATNTYGLVQGNPSGYWRIIKVVSGASTILATTTVSVADGDTVALEMNGDSYTLSINGVVATTVTDPSPSTGLTGTWYGFYVSTTTQDQRWSLIRADALS